MGPLKAANDSQFISSSKPNTGMINFTCQCDWVRDAQITGKTFFLGVSVWMFLEEIRI